MVRIRVSGDQRKQILRLLGRDGYLAISDELQELIAQGCTVVEAMKIAQEVARKLI